MLVFFEKWEWDDIFNIPIIYPMVKRIYCIDTVKFIIISGESPIIITIEWLYLCKFNNKNLEVLTLVLAKKSFLGHTTSDSRGPGRVWNAVIYWKRFG